MADGEARRRGAPLFAALCAALVAGAGWLATARAQAPVPALHERVTDLAGLLDPAARAALASRSEAIETRTGAQVAILIVPGTAPETLEQYSIRVADAWRLGPGRTARADGSGTAPVDDGVLIVVARDDRRVRIEVGYGLEGAIPDAIARRILDEAITPRFREGDFAGGLAAGLDRIGARIAGEALPAPARSTPGRASRDDPVSAVIDLLGVGFVAGLVLSALFGRLAGAALAGTGTGIAVATTTGMAGLALVAAAGLAIALLLFGSFGHRVARTGGHTWRGGPRFDPRGGGWGGGGRGGGWTGGGGRFGGGGASGGW